MNKKPLLPVLMIALLGSCDMVEEDLTPKEVSAILFTYPEKPAIINLGSLSTDLNFRAGILPTLQSGTLESIANGQYLIYKPDLTFKGRQDVVVPISGTALGKTSSGWNLKLDVRDPSEPTTGCTGISGVYDYARVKQGESLNLDLLANDIFCGVSYNGGAVADVAFEGPATENTVISIGPGRSARLRYTPSPGFTGKIKLIYNLGINWLHNGENVNDEELWRNPSKYLEASTTAMIEIEVVN